MVAALGEKAARRQSRAGEHIRLEEHTTLNWRCVKTAASLEECRDVRNRNRTSGAHWRFFRASKSPLKKAAAVDDSGRTWLGTPALDPKQGCLTRHWS